MKRKSIWIWLLLLAILVSCWFEFGYLPRKEAADAAYAIAKLSPFTADRQALSCFANEHMGVQPNATGLFDQLPLAGAERAFWFHSSHYSIHIDFMKGTRVCAAQNLRLRLDEEAYNTLQSSPDFAAACTTELCQALVFDSAVAFALLDDLDMMIYSFGDHDYAIGRAALGQYTGWSFASLLEEKSWQQMQEQLAEPGWAEQIVAEDFLHICYCYQYDQHP